MYIEYRKTQGCKNLWDLKLYAGIVLAEKGCPQIVAPIIFYKKNVQLHFFGHFIFCPFDFLY